MAQRFDGDPREVPAEAVHGRQNTGLPGSIGHEDVTTSPPDTPAAVGRKGGAVYAGPIHSSGISRFGSAVIEPYPAAELQMLRPHSDELVLAAQPKARADEVADNDGHIVHPFAPAWGRAALAGLIATVLFTVAWCPLPYIYQDESLNVALVLGSAVWPQTDAMAGIIGSVALLAIFIGCAMGYAWLLAGSRIPANSNNGAAYGFGLGVAMLTLLYPVAIGLIARFSPYHPYFNMPDMMLTRVGSAGTSWAPGLYALGLFTFWGFVLGSIYRHRLTQGATQPEIEGGEPFYY